MSCGFPYLLRNVRRASTYMFGLCRVCAILALTLDDKQLLSIAILWAATGVASWANALKHSMNDGHVRWSPSNVSILSRGSREPSPESLLFSAVGWKESIHESAEVWRGEVWVSTGLISLFQPSCLEVRTWRPACFAADCEPADPQHKRIQYFPRDSDHPLPDTTHVKGIGWILDPFGTVKQMVFFGTSYEVCSTIWTKNLCWLAHWV